MIILVSFFFSFCGLSQEQNTVKAQQNNTLQQIQEEGVLRVGTSGDYPPFEFYATIDGQRQLVGIDASVAQEIANDLGVELEMKDFGSFDSLIPALEAGNVDMLLAGMSPTEEREKSLDFSESYYEQTQNFIIRERDQNIYNSYESLAGGTIGVQSGTLQEIMAQDIPNVEVSTLTTVSDLILALETGQIDAALIAEPIARLHNEANANITTFEANLENESTLPISAAFNEGNDSLINAVNDSIDQMQEDGKIEDYFNQSVDYFIGSGEGNGSETSQEGNFFAQYSSYFWDGTKTTLFISATSVLLGMVLGSLLALMRISPIRIIKFLGAAYVEFVRGTPLMIQVMIIYFGSGVVYPLSALTAGIVAVTLNSGAYICEIIRSGLGSVDSGQTEAARSLGMSKKQAMRHIIFPQAIKNIWPSLGNEFITVIKESSIVSVIGVSELIFQSRVVRSISFQGIVPLFITAFIYFILTFALTKILNYFEGRMNYE